MWKKIYFNDDSNGFCNVGADLKTRHVITMSQWCASTSSSPGTDVSQTTRGEHGAAQQQALRCRASKRFAALGMLKVGIKSKSFEIENSFAHKGVWGEVGVIHLVGEDSAKVSLFYGDDNRKSRGTERKDYWQFFKQKY